MADDNSKIEDERTLAKIIAEKGVLNIKDAAAVTLQLVKVVSNLHADGKVHRQICPDTVGLNEGMSATLDSIEPKVTLGGIGIDLIPSPSQLHNIPPLSLPAEIKAVQHILTEAGVLLDPRQIDFYQLGALLCFMVSCHSVSDYLRSCKAKADVPESIRPIIDRALGMNAKDQFESAEAFISELEAVISGKSTAEDRSGLSDSIFIEPSSKPETEDRLPFEKLGHYQIIERIGRGGMGDVYKGYDKTLDRFVAIKVLPAQLARQKDFVKRFHAEATAIAKIDHPNIVRIYYSGQDQGHHFFAMQYVDGESLADLLAARKKLTAAESLPVIVQCLAGIGAAHERGLIHRDIKPGNVLLDRHSRRALVTDFGVVKSAHADTQITVTGTIMGTADYIAPEQARGSDVDCRADLYAIGVLMYQMLSGKLPFDAKSATSMMFQHAYEAPPPLSEVAPEVPENLAQVVMKLMSKDPEDRFSCADDILAKLQDIDLQVAGHSGKSQTSIIRAPQFYSTPELPGELMRLTGSNWFARLRNRIVDFFGTHAAQIIEHIQTTGQQVDSAVSEYQRRRDRLAELAREAKTVAADLECQAKASRTAAQSAARRVEAAANETAINRALKEKQESEQAAAELAQLAAEQAQQAEDMDFRLAKVDAQLLRLRSQRDALNARMNAAKARLETDQIKPSKRLIHTSLIFLLVCLVTALVCLLWSIVQKDNALIAHWKFDQGSGNIAYDSAGKNHGKIHGAKWVDGISGGAMSFDGRNDYVSIQDDDSLEGMSELTINMWVKPNSLDNYDCLIHKGDWGDGFLAHVGVGVNRNEDIWWGADAKKPGARVCSNANLSIGEWQMVTLWFKGDHQWKIYKNATEIGSAIARVGAIPTSADNIMIGHGFGNVFTYFDGAIDDVRIYNRALTVPEIKQLYG